jgi:hypothetical protein
MASSAHTTATPTEGQRPDITNGVLGRLAKAWPSAVAGPVGCALVIALAYRGGGYFPEQHLVLGAVAFAVLGLLVGLRPPAYTISTPTLMALMGLCGFAGWTALSSYWSSAPDVALEDFQRSLVYIGLFGLGLVAAGSGRYSRHLVWGVLAVIVVVVSGGLVSRLHPDWISAAGSFSQYSGFRLSYPLTYWNSFGAMGAMGVILGVGLAGDPRSAMPLRSLAAAATIACGTAAYLSFSRGAWLAFFVGIVVLAAMSAHRASLLASIAICGTGLFVAVARLGVYPALITDPGQGAGQLAEGKAFFGFLVFVMLLAAAAQAVVSGSWLPEDVRDFATRLSRPFGLACVALVLLAGGLVYLLRAGDVEGGTAERIERAERWTDRQWDEFMAPAGFSAEGAERLTTARGTRSDLYRVAIDGFQAHPLWGDGAGAFQYRFAHQREVTEKVRDAHSLYFETIGELGLVGLLLLLSFVGAAGWAAVSARRRRSALSGAQSAAAAGAFAVWVAHAGVDWDWQMPGLTGTALLLSAALFPPGVGRRRRNGSRSARDRDPLAETLRRSRRLR